MFSSWFSSWKKSSVSKRWQDTIEKGKFHRAIELGIAKKQETWPYALACLDERREEVTWTAPNYLIGGNVLITYDFGDPETKRDGLFSKTYEAFINLLSDLSSWRLPVSKFTYLIGTEKDIATIHRRVGDVLGIERYSFTVIDLYSGRGIGWDAVDGTMTEIEPAKPQSGT